MKKTAILPESAYRISVLLAIHNRKHMTIESLICLSAQTIISESSNKPEIKPFIFDDGCTDGSAEAVRELCPYARIIRGDGSHFWCKGMNVAWNEAAKGDPDYYLLLNDDTMMMPDALERLLKIAPTPESPIIAVGAIIDPVTRVKTYGGTTLNELKKASPDSEPVECALFNANCVLIPREVYRRVGMFYHGYTHAMGDTDYGRSARRRGIKIYQTSHPVGTCENNPVAGTWRDRSLKRIERFRKLNSIKGLPYREWWTFCRRNYGLGAPRYFLSPTIRILMGR
jgi:GT2 family glycosyltransferase